MLKKIIILIFLCFIHFFVWAQDSIIAVIHFPFNQFNFPEIEKFFLQNTIRTDTSYILKKITIIGHTDQIGSTKYNQQLSEKRANAVKQQLVKFGIAETLMTAVVGKGERELISTLYNEKERQKNRRVIVNFYYNKKVKPTIKTIVPKKENKKETDEDDKTLSEKIRDTSTKKGDKIVLKYINFEGGRHVFLQSSHVALDELYDAMMNIPTLIINIEGHICCNENGEDGLDIDTQTNDLSVRRAKAVYEFLLTKGINEQRMTYEGFGRKFPITLERSEYEKMLNRRVEIKIIDK